MDEKSGYNDMDELNQKSERSVLDKLTDDIFYNPALFRDAMKQLKLDKRIYCHYDVLPSRGDPIIIYIPHYAEDITDLLKTRKWKVKFVKTQYGFYGPIDRPTNQMISKLFVYHF